MNENGGNMYMPVGPVGYGGGDGMFGGQGAWWIIVLLAVLGWGNGFGFGGNGAGNGGGFLGADVQRGFDQSAVINGITGIQNSISNGFANIETAANARQMADMNQNFAMQSAFQNCCCENRLGTADLKYTVATEGAMTRANCNENNQKIMDKLCQLELDGIKQNYEGQLRALQNQLASAQNDIQSLRFAASQGAQTAQILANNDAQTAALEQYLAPVPRPAYIVQNPNCCGQMNYGCGCGCGMTA